MTIEEIKHVEKISIIIPVFNEEKLINSLLANLFSVTQGSNAEIIISDGHKDATTLMAIDDKFLGLKNLMTVKSPLNRGNQMNTAAMSANGSILLFLHADTYLSEAAYKSINEYMKTHVAGAFKINLNSRKFRYRIIETFINFRTTLSNIPYGDQALYIRQDLFFSLNGFFEHPIMEDIDLVRRIRKKGHKMFISDHKITTSCRRWEREGVLKCTLRNWYILLMFFFGKHPDDLVKFYSY